MGYFKAFSYYLVLSIRLYTFINVCHGDVRARIAVIGGGIGGTTAAYELTQLALNYDIHFDLDLYEPGEVGGRIATTRVNGFEFEIGGSVIHDENQYMLSYARRFNISVYKEPEEYKSEDVFGFYDGQEFILIQSHYELLTYLKFWWRYGWDILILNNQLIKPLLSKFGRIYMQQAKEETFDDVRSFLAGLDESFPSLLEYSIEDLLLSHGYCYEFINEFAYLAANVNYNQDIKIHAFVGAVALAGAGERLWSVQGGNKLIPEALLAHSDAKLYKKRVQSIFLMPNSKFALQVDDYHSYIYDYVIVACPLMTNSKDNIKFEGFPKRINGEGPYQKTVATLVHGALNRTYFKYNLPENLPNHIFSVKTNSFFNSIDVINPVTPDKDYDRKVFKIFSKQILTDSQIDLLFLSHDHVSVTQWLAYPRYYLVNRDLKLELHKNLYYVNAIEWAASAMEMSAISGNNAALQVLKEIKANSQHNIVRRMKLSKEYTEHDIFG